MSAGMNAVTSAATYTAAKPTSDLQYLAPQFRQAVESALDECNNSTNNLNAVVYESFRSNALQEIYYARGRTVKPPPSAVTNARSSLFSWHGYGLAVDVIHKDEGWGPGNDWFRAVADIFKKHGCKWGGDWTSPDRPHFQWGKCKPSPSAVARELIAAAGVESVWRAVGADRPTE